MNHNADGVLERCAGKRTVLPHLAGLARVGKESLGQLRSASRMIKLHHLAILTLAQSQVSDYQSGEELLQIQVVQNHDAGMLAVHLPDGRVKFRVITKMKDRYICSIDLCPWHVGRVVVEDTGMFF